MLSCSAASCPSPTHGRYDCYDRAAGLTGTREPSQWSAVSDVFKVLSFVDFIASSTVKVGSFVWVEDPEEAWLDGEVTEVNGVDIKVRCTSGKTVVVKVSNTYPKDMEVPPSGVADMTTLAYLHEPGVLQNLKSRYHLDDIYTYTGDILIAVNPFKQLENLYNDHMIALYKGAPFGSLMPHPFAVADAAYRQMINEGVSQSILVSGESGAGKTETAKTLMKYLAKMGGRAVNDLSNRRSVEDQVLESNPVLEAFGNAKTVRNNNSSRFGKFVEIQFDQRGRISGAAIKTYLLERSRVCQVSDYERNYHCFYMLCAAPPEDTRKLKLEDPTKYRYLNQSRCIKLEGMDDSKEYTKTREAMSIVGISLEEQEAIFRILGAILHLGNIEFTNGEETDSSVPKDKKSLKIAAELFMCDEQALEDSLCKRVMVTPEETLSRCLDPESAAFSRDALAKFVYSRLFDWIVNKINNSIGQDPDSKNMIGVLDIYGFESFKTNSFEQFCINLTNEKLQFHFNEHVLKMEQDEYKKEEIEWNHIEFPDNRYVLELIEKKPGGIIALLDEACMFPRSTHETFSQKMYETFKKNEYFRKPKLARTDFTVCHYAGDVTYQTEQFLEKNKDYVVAEHQALLGSSRCTFIAGLFPLQMEDASKQSKFSSVASQFKQQLALLIERLSTTEPRYIRCVKPNNLLKRSIFENQNVLQQLRCGGMMEAIEICRAGYPTRKLFDEFLDRFSILAASLTLDKRLVPTSYDEKEACKKLLEAVGLEGYQIGKTKVLLMAGQMAELDARRTEVLGRAARIIQWKFRSYLLIKAAINMQAVCRGHLARHRFEDMRRKEAAALKIQRALRIYLERRTYIEAVVTVQSCLRGMSARNALRKKTKATLVIQINCRRFLAETHYKKLKKAAVTTQSAWRARLARKELRELKMAAKETGALQAAKSKLEEQVEDLKLTLELEKRLRVDVEESKTQENAKLQLALQEIQDQFKETKVSLLKEVEAAKKTAEMVTVVKEVPIVDTELVEKLKSENENLKSMVTSLEQKIDETEKKFKETTKISEERLKQVLEAESKALEAESKIVDLKTAMDKLQKMLEDVKNENQVLKQSVSSTPVETASGHFPSTPVKNLQNVHNPSEENASLQGTMFTTPAKIQEPRGSRFDPRHEDVDALINCVTKSVGFSQGKPVAAFTIYRCLLHWKSFEAERTNLFDRLVQMIGSAIKNEEEDNASLAYWLSNTSTLLFMLQQSLKSGGTGDNTPLRNSPSLVWWMTKGFRSPAAEAIRPVDAKVPALHFKQQLAAYVENIIGIIWDNLKTELNTFLTLCIQAPVTHKGNALISDSTAKHWEGITEALDALLSTLKDNFVPPVLIQTIFSQAFSLINVQLFNSLVTRRDNCSFINGEYAKYGLDKLEKWCSETNEEYAGSSWDVLKHTRQAVGFLLIHKKDRISYEDIANDLCPILSIQQHFRLCTLYKDEIYNTESVDQEVIESMEKVMILIDVSDFLLKDDSSNSMSMLIDDLSSSMQDKDFSQVKPAEELVENPSFVFLQ
ncbi:BnaA07g00170D [Brassica napus]|uniref:BnaA07g00170D protein n=1 Tax=Brassica napus TaxID=3708 RepID=A0A078H538_BRANA|nr:BnaA07g00170D [Brassica napus]